MWERLAPISLYYSGLAWSLESYDELQPSFLETWQCFLLTALSPLEPNSVLSTFNTHLSFYNRSAAHDIDSSHPVFKNWFSSILILYYHSLSSEFHFFRHWHLSISTWICPFKHLINMPSYPIVMTLWLFIIFSDWDQSVLHPSPLSYNNYCE